MALKNLRDERASERSILSAGESLVSNVESQIQKAPGTKRMMRKTFGSLCVEHR